MIDHIGLILAVILSGGLILVVFLLILNHTKDNTSQVAYFDNLVSNLSDISIKRLEELKQRNTELEKENKELKKKLLEQE